MKPKTILPAIEHSTSRQLTGSGIKWFLNTHCMATTECGELAFRRRCFERENWPVNCFWWKLFISGLYAVWLIFFHRNLFKISNLVVQLRCIYCFWIIYILTFLSVQILKVKLTLFRLTDAVNSYQRPISIYQPNSHALPPEKLPDDNDKYSAEQHASTSLYGGLKASPWTRFCVRDSRYFNVDSFCKTDFPFNTSNTVHSVNISRGSQTNSTSVSGQSSVHTRVCLSMVRLLAMTQR
jgi:hypothetical protein